MRVRVPDVVADYFERSLNSALPPMGDPESAVRDALNRVIRLGPLQPYLDDSAIEDFYRVNAYFDNRWDARMWEYNQYAGYVQRHGRCPDGSPWCK